MASEGQIDHLADQHKKLEEIIAAELTHPDWDQARVAALKKQKTSNKRRIGTAKSR